MNKFLPYTVLSLMALLIGSCANDADDRYARLVSEWQGKEILLPETMVDFMTGDTIDLSETDFTILIFVDSAGCAGCQMKLPLWNEFLTALDSVACNANFNALLVTNANAEELTNRIKRDEYTHPIINDTTGTCYRFNHLPEDDMFRAFLIDRNRQVIAIGNPILSNSVADLYRAIISGSKTFSSSGTQLMVIDTPKISIGEISPGKEYAYKITLSNLSSDTVFIRSIISSCPCTEAIPADSVIPPHGQQPVHITFKEDSTIGDFYRSIHFFYRDFDNPTVLELSGTIN